MSIEASLISETLIARGEKIAVAESCTGGEILFALTEHAGSSATLWGGIVAYSNESKTCFIGVDPKSINRWGVVSQVVAKEMAQKLHVRSGVNWTIAVTGLAGPSGGSREKPVGTVWIAWCDPNRNVITKHCHFEGNRKKIRRQATSMALKGLLEIMEGTSSMLDIGSEKN